MQLSPSTVPSDSNVLAGLFPAGVSVVAAEGPGLAEPEGFAELMAALAPAPAPAATPAPALSGATAVALVAAQSQPAALVGRAVIVADSRAPGLVAPLESEEIASVEDAEICPPAEQGSEAASGRPSKRNEFSNEEEQPVALPRVREPRRSLHEPVAGLETLIVAQVAAVPGPAADEEVEEDPAELGAEESPLDEDGSPSEESAGDVALPVARTATEISGSVFTEIEPQPEVVRSTLRSRHAAMSEQLSVASPVSTPVAATGATSATEAAELPRVAANPEQMMTKLFAIGQTRELTAASALTIPGATSAIVPDATREIPARAQEPIPALAQPAASETTLPMPGLGSATQPVPFEPLARVVVAAQPAKVPEIETRETAVASEDVEASGQTLPAGTSVGLPVPVQREAALRAAAPRVAAAYTTREKFAADRTIPVGERFSQDYSESISFLSTDSELFASEERAVGIDVAKANAVMPALSSPVAFAPIASAAVSVQDVTSMRIQESPEVSAPETVSNAGQAVEVVLRAVDTAADREQKIVKLEFSVGDADLSVRVELAADEVRTTFRTESPELRAALAHEWQAVSADSAEQGGVRLAPAVISDREQPPSTSPDANSQRHERHAARQEEASASAQQAAARSLLRSASPADAPAVATPAFRALAPAGTAQRLHLFA